MASPVTYNISFTLTTGTTAPTSASFVYDSAAVAGARFSSFVVNWDGLTFDLTASANHPSTFFGTGCKLDGFLLLSGISVCTPPGQQSWKGAITSLASFYFIENAAPIDFALVGGSLEITGTAKSGTGSYSISQVPEPSTALLVLAPLAWLAAKRRSRKSHRPSR